MFRELPESFCHTLDHEPNSVLLRTARFDSDNCKSYLFRDCHRVLIAQTLDEVAEVFAGIEAALRAGFHVAGFLSYECGGHFEPRAFLSNYLQAAQDGLPLAWFGVYRSPVIFDHAYSEATSAEPVSSLHPVSGGRADPDALELEMAASEYGQTIARIKRYIEAGDTYQVNFTTRVKMAYSGGPAALFCELMRNQPVAYGALLNLGQTTIISASPELFFRSHGTRITTQPMKGTAARGKDVEEDRAIADWLAHDEKNRSENVMIVDLLRNDLGRICEAGSIQVDELFSVARYRSLFQMTSTVSGVLQPGLNFHEIFQALFPSGSIVGAPKVRTMQIVQELEHRRRGIYTGAIGFISPHREAVFSVAIRTLVLREGMVEMGVGSGIVYDSDAGEEYAECRLKASFLRQTAPEFELIETMLWDSRYVLLEQHLARLAASAEYFDFVFDREAVTGRLRNSAAEFEAGLRYRVRLRLGASGATYVASALLEGRPTGPGPEMLSVILSSERVCSDDLYLRHKTTHRALYDREFRAAAAQGFDDALFLNERGEVAEGAIHNIIVEMDDRWLTPPLAAGVLPGVFRRHLLETRSNIEERSLTLDDLRQAGRVFLCNSVRGLRDVGSIRAGDDLIFQRAGSPAKALGDTGQW